jgi:hypothetical protein
MDGGGHVMAINVLECGIALLLGLTVLLHQCLYESEDEVSPSPTCTCFSSA